MLRFSKKIYTSGIDNPEMEIGLLSKGLFSARVYVVCLEEKSGSLSLMNTVFLRTRKKIRGDCTVVGLSEGYHAGLKMIRQMTEDCLEATGDADLKEHVLELCGGVR